MRNETNQTDHEALSDEITDPSAINGSEPSDEAIEFYWRPGCPFCMTLERSLKKAGYPMQKKNIWEDPDAAAFVRSVANGNEVVPTVKVGSSFLVNPSPKQVAHAVATELPDLAPARSESKRGFFRRS